MATTMWQSQLHWPCPRCQYTQWSSRINLTHYPFNWPPYYSWHVPAANEGIRSNTLVTGNYLIDWPTARKLNFWFVTLINKNLNVNLQSKCGVGFICQQKSNICSFQQTNLWQSLISKLIWAKYMYFIRIATASICMIDMSCYL